MTTFLLTLLLTLSNSYAEGDTAPPSPSPKSTDTKGIKTVTLEEVIAEGTAAEALKFDPIVSAFQNETTGRLSTGNIVKELKNDLPFHFNTNLKPGNQVGFLGTGKGSEETDVNVLGIPINGPQGGGADLSTFPQYFWSGYSYQIGPSLGAFDPRGVSGSLTLRLWTQDAIGTESTRFTALHSTRRVQQLSVGKSSKNYAFNLGVTGVINGVQSFSDLGRELSRDDIAGPAFTVSAIPYETENTRITSHLIFSDTRISGFQSERSGSLTATQETIRAIPVLQLDQKMSNNVKFKGSLFHDFTFLKNEDPDARSKYYAHVHQLGFESVTSVQDSRIGVSLRNVSYERTNFVDLPEEQVLNLQFTHTLKTETPSGLLTFEPTVAGNAVTRKGFFPIGTFGVRHDMNVRSNFVNRLFGNDETTAGTFGQFFRIGYHRRFPSLLDRYYSQTFSLGGGTTLRVIPNPGLEPENVRSIEAGTDFKAGKMKTQLTGYYRDYKNARYTRSTTVDPAPPPILINFQIVNEGEAYTFGAIHTLDWSVLPVLDLGTRVNFQRSKIYQLRLPFPYSPEWVGVVRADLHDPTNSYGLDAVYKVATSFKAFSETSGSPVTVGRYDYVDLAARASVTKNIQVIFGVENIFDVPISFRSGFPDVGRVYTLSAVGTL